MIAAINAQIKIEFKILKFFREEFSMTPIKHDYVLANAATMTRARNYAEDRIEDRPRHRIEDSEASIFSYKHYIECISCN